MAAAPATAAARRSSGFESGEEMIGEGGEMPEIDRCFIDREYFVEYLQTMNVCI